MIENRLKKGLGRGLSSLLGDASKKIETNKVSINNLTRNKFQPRKYFNKENTAENSRDSVCCKSHCKVFLNGSKYISPNNADKNADNCNECICHNKCISEHC